MTAKSLIPVLVLLALGLVCAYLQWWIPATVFGAATFIVGTIALNRSDKKPDAKRHGL
jgi:hypothetical protein